MLLSRSLRFSDIKVRSILVSSRHDKWKIYNAKKYPNLTTLHINYFPEAWNEVLDLDIQDDPALGEFIKEQLSLISTSDLKEIEIYELRAILQFLFHINLPDNRTDINDVMRDLKRFVDSDETLKSFYKKVEKEQGFEKNYQLSSKKVLHRTVEYLEKISSV